MYILQYDMIQYGWDDCIKHQVGTQHSNVHWFMTNDSAVVSTVQYSMCLASTREKRCHVEKMDAQP